MVPSPAASLSGASTYRGQARFKSADRVSVKAAQSLATAPASLPDIDGEAPTSPRLKADGQQVTKWRRFATTFAGPQEGSEQ
jgi:hypothetical protein